MICLSPQVFTLISKYCKLREELPERGGEMQHTVRVYMLDGRVYVAAREDERDALDVYKTIRSNMTSEEKTLEYVEMKDVMNGLTGERVALVSLGVTAIASLELLLV